MRDREKKRVRDQERTISAVIDDFRAPFRGRRLEANIDLSLLTQNGPALAPQATPGGSQRFRLGSSQLGGGDGLG